MPAEITDADRAEARKILGVYPTWPWRELNRASRDAINAKAQALADARAATEGTR